MNKGKIFRLALHGGAGTIEPHLLTPEKEQAYHLAIREALLTGYKILKDGGSSLDAVEATVVSLENTPLFNAGKGSVFTHDGKHEMDASIMNGQNLMAGAVSGINNIKNPVKLARLIMDETEHVYLSGAGAIELALQKGLEFADDQYFYTEERWKQLENARKNDRIQLDHSADSDKKFGTVGAVALDIYGNLAASTSTGGMTNKRFGRVGDSPIIGSGTYANNNTCAISCTGHGEFFIRGVVAYDVSCLMEYGAYSLSDACEKVILEKQVKLGGEGGLIGLDRSGNIKFCFNSSGMYRGSVSEKEDFYTGIFK